MDSASAGTTGRARGVGLPAWAAALGLVGSAALSAEVHVSPNGNDAGPGTAAQPLQTFAAAVRAVRPLAGRQPVTVLFHRGTYYLPETVVLTAADSGRAEAPVVYAAAPGEEAVISGGLKLELAWTAHAGGIQQAQTPTGLQIDQVFVDGTRQHMARYPNFDPAVPHFNGFAADAFGRERAARWAEPAGGFLHAMHAHLWGDEHWVITGKRADGELEYEGGWQNNRPSPPHKTYRFVENVFEELDAPGEWFHNARTSTLYLSPEPGVDLARATVEVVRLRHLLEFRGSEDAPVRFITLAGLTFRHAARTFMDNREPLLRSDWTTYRGGAVLVTGAEDCAVTDCTFDQVGGNTIFVSHYNRRIAVRGCLIRDSGANGVSFIGDPRAVRSPLFRYDQRLTVDQLDLTPGPQTANYPADCLVEDCLITRTGRFEKQTAPVTIDMARRITVRHCSIYDVPRAGINMGDGCWGGHLVEFCDVFDTVQETGDHGSFNSWGRDRYWVPPIPEVDQRVAAQPGLPALDAVEPVTLRNNRWRCDHGWDIDLDDGSSYYVIRDNLCLNGGIKNREGFGRVVENNIMVNNGFHPHCWFRESGDVVRRNILFAEAYLPAGGMPDAPWGRDLDANLVHRPGVATPTPAAAMAAQSRRDTHSLVADARFVDPAAGDFRVQDGSPALALGFVNFPMDRFGVRKPELRALARTPAIPTPGTATPAAGVASAPATTFPEYAWGARVRTISGLGDRSAYGLPGEYGVLFLEVPPESLAARAGLRRNDVVLAAGGQEARTVAELGAARDRAAGQALALSVSRQQGATVVEVRDYPFAVVEYRDDPTFAAVPLAPAGRVLAAKAEVGPPGTATVNEPVATLTDGQLAHNYGPVFGNGVLGGLYRLDLGTAKAVGQVDTYSFNQNRNRGRQRFVLYGSAAATDPGWNVLDPSVFTPVLEVDTAIPAGTAFVATGIRRGQGTPLGTFRWLVWATRPVTATAGGENTAFQELQVLAPAEAGAR